MVDNQRILQIAKSVYKQVERLLEIYDPIMWDEIDDHESDAETYILRTELIIHEYDPQSPLKNYLTKERKEKSSDRYGINDNKQGILSDLQNRHLLLEILISHLIELEGN